MTGKAYREKKGYDVRTKKTKVEKRLTNQEADRLLESITPDTHKGYWKRNKAVIQFLLNTGLRIGEMHGLLISDLIGINGKLKDVLYVRPEIAKRKKARNIPLNRKAQESVKFLIEDRPEVLITDSLVVQPNGKPLGKKALQDIVKLSALKAGIDRLVGPHNLRHTCLSQLYEKTKNVKVVQTIAGHARSQLTIDLYTHATMDGLTEAMKTLDDEETNGDDKQKGASGEGEKSRPK